MSVIARISNYFEKIFDWTCLEKLKPRRITICLLTFEFILSVVLLVPSMIVHFTYVNHAGRAGFVDKKWLNHTDIYKFRRSQPWEKSKPVDWNEERQQLNLTRQRLDEECSTYDNKTLIPGDPGDYLKEVAGHPNQAGYNHNIVLIVRMWTASISMMYFSCPILLLALWWKKQTGMLLLIYVFVQLFPMFLLVAASSTANTQLMCAVDIIYDGIRLKLWLIVFICLLWVYKVGTFVILFLHYVDQTLALKRRSYGFRRRGPKKRQVGPEQADHSGGADEEDHHHHHLAAAEDDYDIEKIVAKERKAFRKAAHKNEKMIGQSIARELLELGTTTQEDTTEPEGGNVKNENRHSLSANADSGGKRVSFNPPKAM